MSSIYAIFLHPLPRQTSQPLEAGPAGHSIGARGNHKASFGWAVPGLEEIISSRINSACKKMVWATKFCSVGPALIKIPAIPGHSFSPTAQKKLLPEPPEKKQRRSSEVSGRVSGHGGGGSWGLRWRESVWTATR
jgi:hypothetical protein